MKLTKDKIEAFAYDVAKWASENHLGHDYSVFYNNAMSPYMTDFHHFL